jgi:tRNA/tmRNA/rRNA uracil-C5-methylase (TrmA/RlmC/RlmD family)
MKPMKNNHVPDQLKLYAVVRPDGTTVKIVTDEESARRAMAEDLQKQLSPKEFEAIRSCMMKGERSPEADRLIRTVDSYKVELVHSRKLKKGELALLLSAQEAEEEKPNEHDRLSSRVRKIVKALANLFGDLNVNPYEAASAMGLIFTFMAERQPANRTAIVGTLRTTADIIEGPESE